MLNGLKYGNDEIQCFCVDAQHTRSALPSPHPFRINFTVSVTGKSWGKQKTRPCGRSGPLPPSIEAQDPVIVRFLPTLPWSDDLSILPIWLNMEPIILNLSVYHRPCCRKEAWIEIDALCIYIELGQETRPGHTNIFHRPLFLSHALGVCILQRT